MNLNYTNRKERRQTHMLRALNSIYMALNSTKIVFRKHFLERIRYEIKVKILGSSTQHIWRCNVLFCTLYRGK